MTMDVKIIDCDINMQELFKEVSDSGSGCVSLYAGTRKDISEKSALGTVSGENSYQIFKTYLTEVCKNVKRKFNITYIAIYYSLDASLDKPCLAIGSLAPTYQSASEAVNSAVELINGQNRLHGSDDISEPQVDIVSSDLIQVKAGVQEINQRIHSFIERRRAQVNADNIRDFCSSNLPNDDTSCARVDAVKIHRKDSRSHLRIRKVVNTWGPQTASSYFESKQNNTENDEQHESESKKLKLENESLQSGNSSSTFNKLLLEERLKNIEDHVGFGGESSRDIHSRLKMIEDKILYLEGLSPEYFELWKEKPQETWSSSKKNVQKRSYSTKELSSKIKELELDINASQ